MLAQENLVPTFSHPEDWDSMSDIEKAHLMVKVYFLKLLAIIDFSDYVFKEVQSLFTEIEDFLNQDMWLEIN